MFRLLPDTFIKNENCAYFWVNSLKWSTKVFSKNQRRSGTSLPVSFLHGFLHGFWGKIFLTLYSNNWQYFIASLPLPLEIPGIMCIIIICLPVCDVINFGINLSFLIKPFIKSLPRYQVITLSRYQVSLNNGPLSLQNTTALSCGLSDHHNLELLWLSNSCLKIHWNKYIIEIINNLIRKLLNTILIQDKMETLTLILNLKIKLLKF